MAAAGCGEAPRTGSPDAGAAEAADGSPRDAHAPVDASQQPSVDAGPFVDGVCTVSDLSLGELDPDCMYLMGTTKEGDADRSVLVNLADPGAFRYGFGQYHSAPVIRPSDGRLLFWDKRYSGDCRPGSQYCVFEWNPDATPSAFPTPLDIMLSNDAVLDTPACGFWGPRGVLVFPDDGATAYLCDGKTLADENVLYMEGESAPALDGKSETPIALGAHRAVLLASDTTISVVDMLGERVPVDAGAFDRVITARWNDGKFSVAILRDLSTRTIDLVDVSVDGELSHVGTYDVGTGLIAYYSCKLDLAGALTCVVWPPDYAPDLVRTFYIDAPPSTLYDESEHAVKIHVSRIVSGA